MLTYTETLDYLYKNLPMFQRIGAAALKNDLYNTIALCKALGDPQRKFKSIHVAGTNGKGSTSHMLASVLQSAGYKTGLFTSPHLKSFTERIRVNGQEVEKDFVVDFVGRVRGQIELLQPSFFEITVAMAFDYFAREKVEVAVVEVGLGGRLDSTNVITPELSLITNIGWDHKDLLGDTLVKIAGEKAGIIKPGVPVVISQRQLEVETVFMDKALSGSSPLWFASDEYAVTAEVKDGQVFHTVAKQGRAVFSNLPLPLQGIYQQKNLPGVLKAIELLRGMNFALPDEAVVQGLVQVTAQTGLKGRWQTLGQHPLIICDTGHNEDGIREIVRQIGQQRFERLWMVIGVVKDKDIGNILRLLPTNANYYFCQAKIPRALDAHLLAAQAAGYGLKGEVIANVPDAVNTAKRNAAPSDMIFIGGSTFVVAEVEDL